MHLKTNSGADAAQNWAFHLPLGIRNFPVQTSWGDTLYANRDGIGHGVGDFIVCSDANGMPNLSDMWVVNGEVFPTTYDMRAFPGLGLTGDKAAETPVPKSIAGMRKATEPKADGIDSAKSSKRTMYQIVGRYMNGREAVAYHLQSIDKDKSGRYTREQVCFLVGRDQITNCEAQLYSGKVLLRGKGVSFDGLPSKQINGEFKNTEALGRVKKDTTVENAMAQFTLVGVLKQGNQIVGYTIKNAGNATKRISRQKLIELASDDRIGNAKIQNRDGKQYLLGINCNLRELPVEQLEMAEGGAKPAAKPTKSLPDVSNMDPNHLVKTFDELKAALELYKPKDIAGHTFKLTNTETRYGYTTDNNSHYMFVINDAGALKVEWSASNGFDGGRASLDDNTTLAELEEYLQKARSRIYTLCIH